MEHHGNRHGRSEPARQAVLQAADDLLVEKGLAGLTVEGIATAAGVAKQTIYRWWPNKIDILFEAYAADAEEHFVEADHGDLATDVRDTLGQLAAFLTDPEAGAMFRALAGWAQQGQTAATRFRAEVVEPQRERDRAPFLRAAVGNTCPAVSTSRRPSTARPAPSSLGSFSLVARWLPAFSTPW